MALQNFVDNNLPTIKAAWLNAVDLIQNVVTGSAGGIAVTGTISAAATNGSGILALSSSTGTNGVTETFTNTGGTYTIGVDNSVGDIFGSAYSFGLNIPTSRTFDVNVNNTQVMRVSSAGLAVTGTSNATATVEDIQVITNATGINASLTNYVNTGGTVRVGVDRSTGGFSGSAYAYFVSVASGRSIQNVVNGTAITSVSSTGLAVTGGLSATGVANFLGGSSLGLTIRANGLTTEEFNGTDSILVNYNGYLNGTTQYRGFKIYNGKQALIGDFSSTGLAVTGTTSTTTGMAVGGATAGAGGIAFPATAVAVVDVNTLDDYEEGTFTPAISAGAGSITASSATGSYTKIGNRVFYEVVLTITTNGTGATSLIFTLPFTAAQHHTPVGVNTSSAETCVGISTTTDVVVRTYSGLYPVSSGNVLRVSGNYIV